ncbi:Ig-like and fibronectin type-III domain-containing protein 1, partial [Amphibalanus amphitrite]|uniref:Ig-like and fibronectin type-III domain-containing protein 1 n=1 Tax=Amphibalanus amphitrite TaxID=1232801 RepID=UPI001C91BB13
ELNVTGQFALVDNLTASQLYGFTVVAVNEYGTSLPSSIITINVTDQHGDVMQKAVTSHPHSLSVSELSATQLTVSWAPPVISHPTERLRYRVSYRGPNATEYTNVTTAALLLKLVKLTPNSQYSVFVTALSGLGESRPSETLQMWTSPAYPAYVELPTIHPTDMVKEGGSMTVLCIAMAAPEPTVALYINGRHVTEGRTRHLVTTIRNVTRDMSQVTCYADNGYGTPMQSTRHIIISRRPMIRSRPTYVAKEGSSVTLRCKVDASPEPQMVFFRDPSQRQAVIDGGNYVITLSSGQTEGDHTMELMIKQVTAEDFGNFYCHAENVFGGMTKLVTLTQQKEAPKLYNLGVTECCRRLNVSTQCQRACAFDVDLDAVLAMPECAREMGKLMTCAADGSDHRRCCANKIVPTRCLDWCRGEPVAAVQECSIGYAKEIVDCFEEGKAVLPGPPLNVRVESVSSNAVRVRWDEPDKNADKVEVYRVYWRAPDDKISSRNDTRSTSLRISGLRAGVEYECAVKSGNHYGSSQLTTPIMFVPGRIFVSSESTDENYYIGTGTVLAVVIILVLVLAVMMVGAVLYRRKRRKAGAADRVSFENPSYLREMNLENLQNTSESSFSGGLNGTHGFHSNGDPVTLSVNSHRQTPPQSNGGSQSASPARFVALRNGLGLVAKKAGFKQFENEQ